MSSAASRPLRTTGGGSTRPPFASLRRRIAGSPWTYRALVLAIVGLVWQVYATAAESLLIPKFTDTVVGVFTLVQDIETWEAFWLSNQALIWGFAISLTTGIVAGLAAARFRSIEGFIDPYLNILLVTPMAALIPLLIMSLGIGMASRIVLVFVFSVPVIIVNTRAGVRQVEANLIEMAHSYGATERQVWRKILLPGSLPAVMTGVRLGLGRAVTGMVVVELLFVAVGIGNLITGFRGSFDPDLLYAVVILVVIEALILISIVRAVEHRIAPWAHGTVLRE
jgi:ABC-type nitrate/sulfonate/bicarbonate transport system permease component